MGDIGKKKKTIEVIPATEPARTEPAAPAEPAPAPAKEPAKEPVPV